MDERIKSDAFKTDTIGQLVEYVNTLKLIYKDDDRCKELHEKLNSKINLLTLDDDRESRDTEKSKLKRCNSDEGFDKVENNKHYKKS
ncbi:MAG: hypothetical protein WC748_08135 [Legionellales bacterium]